MGAIAMILVFSKLSFKPVFSLTTFKPISRGSLVPLHFLPLEGFICISKLFIFLPAILIPACDSPSLSFCMMYSAYKLNKQDDILDVIPSKFWTSRLFHVQFYWPAYRFLRRQVSWSGIPISLRIFHNLLCGYTVKGFSIVNEAEVDIFLEFPCFLYVPINVGNLISASSAFLKPDCTFGSSWFMYCWSLAWRILNITLLACEMSVIVC